MTFLNKSEKSSTKTKVDTKTMKKLSLPNEIRYFDYNFVETH